MSPRAWEGAVDADVVKNVEDDICFGFFFSWFDPSWSDALCFLDLILFDLVRCPFIWKSWPIPLPDADFLINLLLHELHGFKPHRVTMMFSRRKSPIFAEKVSSFSQHVCSFEVAYRQHARSTRTWAGLLIPATCRSLFPYPKLNLLTVLLD
jgi:hypothetical protein